jgi:polyhydroxyalkanoate synthesis regulator phasin
MLEDVRKNVLGFVEAGVAAVSGALTPARAREMARGLAGGEGSRQVNRVAQEMLEWSQRSREWISELVAREVKRQLSAVGIATREDLDALRKRVRELERARGAGAGPGPKKSGARKSPATKSPGKKSGAKKAAAARPPRAPSSEEATGLGDPGPSVP